MSYPRYWTLQTPETQPSSRGREHRRDRGPNAVLVRSGVPRTGQRSRGGGSAAGAFAGRLRRRRAATLVSHGCSPGESGVARLAAARPATCRGQPARLRAVRRGVGGGACTGGSEQRLAALHSVSYLDQLHITKVDCLSSATTILTFDHIGCIPDVLEQFSLQHEAYDRGDTYPGATCTAYIAAVKPHRTTAVEGTSIESRQGQRPLGIHHISSQ